MSSYKRSKKDNNHDELIVALSGLVPVMDLYQYGGKLLDGQAYINGGWQIFDIKNPNTHYGRKGLNESQRKQVLKLGSPVYLLYTIEDVIAFAKGDFGSVKQFPESKVKAADI